MARIAIIGGTGFIGTRLVATLLNGGHDVRIVDRKRSATFPDLWVPGDVCSLPSLERACGDVDVIYNLAAEHRDDVRPVSLYRHVNVEGARNVCETARRCRVKKIIFTSSVAVYGLQNDGPDEATEPVPFNEYGRTKLAAEHVYRGWQATSSKHSLVIVRPTVVFGEGNRGNVYNLLRQIASGRFVMIGDGKNRKSMAYVENVAAFLKFALKFESGPYTYNYADTPNLSMSELVKIARCQLGFGTNRDWRLPRHVATGIGYGCDIAGIVTRRRFPISSLRVKKFCATTVFSTARLQSSGFIPPVSLDAALERTIEFEFQSLRKERQAA